MNSVTLIFTFVALMAFSLVVVGFTNRIQTQGRLTRYKSLQLKVRIDDLEEIGKAIEPLLESVLIPMLINEEVLDLIRSLEQLDPTEPSIEIRRDLATEVAHNLDSGQRTQPLYRAQTSDASLARNKQYLAEAGKIVRRHHSLGRLDSTEHDAYIQELTWAYLMVDVISFITEGHKAANRNEAMHAYGFYRKAQNQLMASTVRDNRRHRFVKELSDMFAGKRLAISSELMPEVEYNPTQKPSFIPTPAGPTEQSS